MSDLPADSKPDDNELYGLRERAELLERRLAELQKKSEDRLLLAELKAEALRAGMVDLDGLKLVDLSSVKLNENGEVEDAAQIMAQLKKAKPWLFGVQSSSSSLIPPPAQPIKPKLATEMTDDEYRVARSALLKQRP